MNFRWVWLNCFLVKVIKVLANVLSTARYTGRNFVVGYFNFSTIAYVYLAGIPLMYRNNFMDYGNSDVATLTTATQLLDGITVDFFNSVLMRGYPGLIFLMFVSLMAVLTLDVAINRKWRHQVANNSLGRQHLYNSTSIIADVGYSFLTWPDFKGQAISMSVRSLCMMQWFLTCHTLRFGLPEDPSNVRGMTSKAGSALSQVVTTTQRRSVGTWREGRQQSSASVANEFFMVTQDSDGYIHLFNARKTEIQALSMEVNVQADAKYVLT
ncbi:hypothetical protein DYB32_009050 [Aphanomyces invadans]|uniref:Uncharacterized protein n=1 Tax=Aphanomyces invadans TaxID=157072 RepID=A0A3R6ZJ51_9STRA|nr:hypothetical protein DYB32_009050 [Aphanomyces invadans]